MKTKQMEIVTHVEKVREVQPIMNGRKEPDGKTTFELGPKQYEVVLNLCFVLSSDHKVVKGNRARVILEIDVEA